MGSSQNLSNARWRKSSYSGNTGGDCVEVADLGLPGVAVRDSKNPGVGIVTVAPEAYSRLKDWVTSAAKS
ncbi:MULTISPECIES: DUF397 domain-containing protein [Streptomyces]|uniref:DUF397 domain-containing protein n=1 Tax=Streptomyces TaxID=1883 RepID=UPI00287F5E63|nr:DUF397 domain-containing protein [Streptomyces sp. CGMCC 4.1456]WNF63715.1 DUF397 domain-containing protein [Streptomyces sp. CGMCC 4.1456]